MDLGKIKIGVSPLCGNIYLYREGVKPGVALDKREAEPDVMMAVVRHLLWQETGAVSKEFHFGGKWYRVTAEELGEVPDEVPTSAPAGWE